METWICRLQLFSFEKLLILSYSNQSKAKHFTAHMYRIITVSITQDSNHGYPSLINTFILSLGTPRTLLIQNTKNKRIKILFKLLSSCSWKGPTGTWIGSMFHLLVMLLSLYKLNVLWWDQTFIQRLDSNMYSKGKTIAPTIVAPKDFKVEKFYYQASHLWLTLANPFEVLCTSWSSLLKFDSNFFFFKW